MSFVTLLVEKGILSRADASAVLADMAKKVSLADALNAHGGLVLSEILETIAREHGLSGRLLGDPPATEEALKYIPVESARHYGFVPLDVADGALEVGITDPNNIEAVDALQFISSKIGKPYKIFLITTEDFNKVLEAYKNLTGEVGKALSEFDSVNKSRDASEAKQKTSGQAAAAAQLTGEEKLDLTETSTTLKEDAPVTKIVSTILRYAIDGRASDIHIEPFPTKTRVRFRMDGDLHTSLELPPKVHDAVVARIKILSQLRLDEKRKPQDGRFSATVDRRRIDFRVSTFPTEYGEKVVMRILDQAATNVTLTTIGFEENYLKEIHQMLETPYGIILIAGPTGSGKSTTLFSMLSELDREIQNVVSLEDPIEYQIPGVSQSQVRPEIGYDFANGLRSILRQDPDVIMVGEIRDKETAALAIQAALTGHLVFSTIHTNTAAGAIPRLVDMDIDPYLIAPTLIAVIGQRLVRKLSDGAGKPFPVSASLKGLLDEEFVDLPDQYKKKLPAFTQFYHATPTADSPSGMSGRTAVFEILHMTKKLESVILANAVEEKVYAAAREEGMFTMRENAILKASRGAIPFEEVNTLGGKLFPEGDMDNA